MYLCGFHILLKALLIALVMQIKDEFVDKNVWTLTITFKRFIFNFSIQSTVCISLAMYLKFDTSKFWL